MIQLRTLGSVELHGTQGESVDRVLAQPKRLALLAYLALARPRGLQRRDVLLGLFWPESDAARAREALNQALRFLRRFLERDAVHSRGDEEVGVDPSRLWCDAVAFEERIDARDDAEALALYRGDLLVGFFLSEAPIFERWLDAERGRLQKLARAAACRLLARCESAGDLGGAVRWARRALDLAPHDETVLRHLLELLDRSGERATAVQEYEAFAKRLREELEVEPAPETRAVVDAVRVRATPNEPPRSAWPAPVVTPAPTRPVSQADVLGPPRRRRTIPRLARVTALGALVLMSAVGVTIVARRDADLHPNRIAVIPFDNRTGDPALDPVGMIAADWIVQGLARLDVVDVVPSLNASQLLGALSAEARSQNAGNRARTFARALGAGTVVVGSYFKRGGNLEFQAQIIDARSSRLLQAVDGIRGLQSDPMAAIDELRRKTLGGVGVHFDARVTRPGLPLPGADRPPSYEAYQAFAAGMDQRNQGAYRQSLAYFRQAFALDTTFTTALFLSAIADLNLGEFAEADSLIRMLGRSRERLTGLERAILEWAEAEVRGDLQGALDAIRKVIRYGDGYRSQMAVDALVANRPREAIVAQAGADMERLLEYQPPKWKIAYGRRITDAYHRLGSHERELAEAKRARKRQPGEAEPVVWEMRALIALGRVQRARERLEDALAMPPTSDWPPGEIMLRVADELHAHGHVRAAQEVLLRTIAWYRALPDSQAKLLRHRRYLAATLLRADSLDAAERAFEELAHEFPEDPYYIASVAVALAQRGNQEAASAVAQTALSNSPPYDFGHTLYERSRIAAQLGNVEEAIDMLKQAFANGFDFAFVGGARGPTAARSPDGAPHLDPAFDGLRGHPAFLQLYRGKD